MTSPVSALKTKESLPRIHYYSRANLEKMPCLDRLSAEQVHAIRVVSTVLPFKVNQYMLSLIDWNQVPRDPIFQLTFPQRAMLSPEHFDRMANLLRSQASPGEVQMAARKIQKELNPHPSGQMEHNVPTLDGQRLPGMQHKYQQTVLFFPAQGQTCHSYCTFCFRWAQFVGQEEVRFASRQVETLVEYLKRHREVTDVLITGGDPMIMPTRILQGYLEALLQPGLEHIQNIRIGTKSVSYWPYRYLTDPDADELLLLLDKVASSGKQLAIMAHYNHYRELESEPAQRAVARLRSAGCQIRCQSPLVRHINDSPEVWERMWKLQTRLGLVPYYMFVERDTGPRNYFEVPLARAHEIFRQAYRRVSGLARTVRGPSMSATPGKILVEGVAELGGQKVFVLKFLQARDPNLVGQPFFARFDPEATWFDQLKPVSGEGFFNLAPALAAAGQNAPYQACEGQPLFAAASR